MQKIMFNDLYCLTDAAIEGYKTNTRRIEGKDQFQEMAACADHIFYNEDTGLIDFMFKGVDIFNYKPRYKVGEVVAVAQCYNDVVREFTDLALVPGSTNKMYVRAELMPHQIRITGIRVDRLQDDITDVDCMKEGVRVEYEEDIIPKYYYFDAKQQKKVWFDTSRDAFASLIDKVSGRGTWKSNPWVVAYEFELVK